MLWFGALDMAALHVLGSIEGWYNVADAADRPRGQIKVRLQKRRPQTLRRCVLEPRTGAGSL
jgi:hypothetical protein